MAWSEITNPYHYVRNMVKDETGQWVDKTKTVETQHTAQRNDIDIGPGNNHIIFETWGKKVILESIHVSTTSRLHPRLEISENNPIPYTTQLFHGISVNGTPSALYRDILETSYNDYIELYTEGDTTRYTFFLKKPIVLPEGCRLDLNVSSADEGDTITTYKVFWREIEEV